jgi:hypothetical protein
VVFFIKILLPLEHEELSYEGVWIKELTGNTGEINNIPLYTKEYKFADIIEFDPQTHKVIRLLQDGGYTPAETVEYNGRFADEKAKWEAKGYVIEGIATGKLAVARKCK